MSLCCKCSGILNKDDSKYGLHIECYKDWFELDSFCEFTDIIPRSQSLAPLENREKNTSFFHGAFKKYSSRLGKNNYILKVVQEGHPELPATEFVCNQIFESLGVHVPDYFLIQYPNPENHFCFVTKNFMPRFPNSSLVHIYHYLEKKEEHNCEKIVSIIGQQTGRRIEQEKFAYLTLADSLIGNHDRHGRNLGFIQSPKGMILAPFYDNPSFIGLDNDMMLGADLQPRGAVFTGLTDEPLLKDYVIEWNRLGYGNVVDEFKKAFRLEDIRGIIEAGKLTNKRGMALYRLIEKRGRELCEI